MKQHQQYNLARNNEGDANEDEEAGLLLNAATSGLEPANSFELDASHTSFHAGVFVCSRS